MSTRTTISYNGTRYDASRGNLRPINRPSPQSMDGVVHSKPQSHAKAHEPAASVTRKGQKATTLHRGAVKKPQRMDVTSPKHSAPVKRELPTVDVRRAEHAQHIEKAASVSRFPSHVMSSDVTVAPPEGQHFHGSAVPSTPPVAPPISKSELFIERQLRKAEAHHQQAHKKKGVREHVAKLKTGSRRNISLAASVMAVVLIAGFIVYQNIPGFSMQLASHRAGFSAMLPAYTPNGYSVKGPVTYSPGKVIVSFRSNTNDHKYQIEQQPSQWSTETLREQVASANGSQYQTYESKGLTLYFTDNNSATWVDHGILFSLRGDSALSGEQIASIAASM